MSSNSNKDINAAYIALWKKNNKNLVDIETDGTFLLYKGEKINISDIYMQDILRNPTIFNNIKEMSSEELVAIIKTHIDALKIKNIELEEKVRRYNMSDQPLSNSATSISVDRFFELIAKSEEELNSNAIYLLQIEEFMKKIKRFQELAEEDMLTEPSSSILTEYNNLARKLLLKENKTELEEKVIEPFLSEEEFENKTTPTRTMKKELQFPTHQSNNAGRIDAIVILVILLNIGFIVAMTLLGNR